MEEGEGLVCGGCVEEVFGELWWVGFGRVGRGEGWGMEGRGEGGW